jgi:hypothetical protein
MENFAAEQQMIGLILVLQAMRDHFCAKAACLRDTFCRVHVQFAKGDMRAYIGKLGYEYKCGLDNESANLKLSHLLDP